MKIVFLCFATIFSFDGCEGILDSDILENDLYEEPFENLEDWGNKTVTLSFQNLDRVLVCLNEEAAYQLMKPFRFDLRPKILNQFSDLNIEYHSVSSCQKNIKTDDEEHRTKTIIAVVAPEPFWSDSEEFFSEIPMYFYNSPHVDQERADAFPNGLIPHQRQWRLLKHAVIHHISKHEWKRIAIVSDNSLDSKEFERELVDLFKENKYVWNEQGCVKSGRDDCNFNRALHFLRYHSAVIIIANVEGQNVRRLVENAESLGMTSPQYLWLVRDWTFTDTQTFQNVISITLSPMPAANYPDKYPKAPHLNSIWRGLDLISKAVDSVQEKERVDKYYRSIFKKMNNSYSHNMAMAFIRSRSPDYTKTIVIRNADVKCTYQKGSDIQMHDLREYCLLKSDSFTSPCDDTWVVLICIVWLMFALMVFLLIYFFSRCLVWT